MTAKEYLRRFTETGRNIRLCRDRIEYLRAAATATKGPVNSGMPPLPSRAADAPFVKPVLAYVDLETALAEEKTRYGEMRETVASAIDGLASPTERLVLTLRYLEDMPYREIAEVMGVTECSVYRRHGAAVSKIRIEGCEG